MKEVSGTVQLHWCVDLPDDYQLNKGKGKYTDPAITAVMDLIPKRGWVSVRGDAGTPVLVHTKMYKADFNIEVDLRGPKPAEDR